MAALNLNINLTLNMVNTVCIRPREGFVIG